MFINAEPGYVSNGFEAFVPFHGTEAAFHQRLVEMANNDAKAWSIFRPVLSSTSGSWDGNLDEYSNNENFQVHSLYGGYYPETCCVTPSQAVDLPGIVGYSQAHQPQHQSYENISTSQPPYQEQTSEMICLGRPSPMLGNDYSQMSLVRGRGSFAEFSSVRNVLKNVGHQPQANGGNSSFTSPSGLPQSTYAERTSMQDNSMKISATSAEIVHSSYSEPQAFADCRTIDSTNTRSSDISTIKAYCWPDNLRGSKGPISSFELPFSNDGLPRCPPQQYSDPWSSTSGSTSTWGPQSLASNTISPKLLTLNVSSASLSSSGSSQDSLLALSDSSPVMAVDGPGVRFIPEELQLVEPQPLRRHRTALPDCVPSSRRFVPVVPSNDFPPSRNAKKHSKVIKFPRYTRRKSSPPPKDIQNPSYNHSPSPSPRISEACSPRSVATPAWIDPKAWQPAISPQPRAEAQVLETRESRDEFLVNSRLAGMSYKDIRRQGNFKEAESTLRGRFRTLTKDKTQRVRKPEWEDNDVRLLKRAVLKLSRESDRAKGKIPWKLVAEYIANNGGSYHFGNSTCRKRWDELEGRSRWQLVGTI
ncbi:hypothetical protein ONS95_002562 [Cadophora gregata]|uniref:uncharacterized protein n=1 Tax=Cadophora gregata TaxID=51156 RepID=UPI0026DDC31B|nr:uncharacterized protein ONS95_002562 [Cadophora gregata]KAK0109892.1 hypothetical protein ONS95_002562 [Cadophora gregata]KAK0110482.1 hypothetical protein ONS96_002091 [Cadophora gregata f. sp. sojae]